MSTLKKVTNHISEKPTQTVDFEELRKDFYIPWAKKDKSEFVLGFPSQRRLMTYKSLYVNNQTRRVVWWPWTYIFVSALWIKKVPPNRRYTMSVEELQKAPYAMEFTFTNVFFAKDKLKKPTEYVYGSWLPNIEYGNKPCLGPKTPVKLKSTFTETLNNRVVDFFGNTYNNDAHYKVLEHPMVEYFIDEFSIDARKLPVRDPYPEILKYWGRLSRKKLLSIDEKNWGPKMSLNSVRANFNFKSALSFV